jgi:phosphoenolpyruvate carboxykinase (ATP)
MGVTEPQATFSACFGAAFLVWHPTVYAELLAEKMREHGTRAWLVNTGWTGGAYGTGNRISLKYTRAIIDAIHGGDLSDVPTATDPIFGVEVPTSCPGVDPQVLTPRNTWQNTPDFDATARKLAALFHRNFGEYEDQSSEAIRNAGPRRF